MYACHINKNRCLDIRYLTALWYHFHDWLNYGQRSSPAEWIIEYGLDQIDPQIQDRIRNTQLPIVYPMDDHYR